MDNETRLALVAGVGEEVVTREELRALLESKEHPIAYDGFEPSGLAHLPFGVFRPLLLKELLRAGVHFKLYLADWFAWINNKMGGDLERIRKVGEYFIEVWKAAGVEPGAKVRFVWSSDVAAEREYWRKVVLIAKHTTVQRANRALTIMGRKEGELGEVAQYFYPMMQTADIFQLEADICQLGLDQRRANMLARDVAEKLGWRKPVVVSHHMLLGLQGMKEPEGYEENRQLDSAISSKMSKSKPASAIFVHDSAEDIARKINSAFCPAKVVEGNSVLDYAKHILFRAKPLLTVERPAKFGGTVSFASYAELETAYRAGLHPQDLKHAVAAGLESLIAPVRAHFEHGRARELFEFVKQQEVTR